MFVVCFLQTRNVICNIFYIWRLWKTVLVAMLSPVARTIDVVILSRDWTQFSFHSRLPRCRDRTRCFYTQTAFTCSDMDTPQRKREKDGAFEGATMKSVGENAHVKGIVCARDRCTSQSKQISFATRPETLSELWASAQSMLCTNVLDYSVRQRSL